MKRTIEHAPAQTFTHAEKTSISCCFIADLKTRVPTNSHVNKALETCQRKIRNKAMKKELIFLVVAAAASAVVSVAALYFFLPLPRLIIFPFCETSPLSFVSFRIPLPSRYVSPLMV